MEENRKDRRKTGLLLSILGVISLVLITAGVTYAFFSYAKEGQTENVITTGTIQFAYNETDTQGNGILLQDALPISDTDGKALDGTAGNRKAFNFTVTSITPSTAKIPYVVTVKKQNGSTLADEQIKLYLVATGSETGNGTTEVSGVVQTFDDLPALDATSLNNANANYATLFGDLADPAEKVLFTGLVPASSSSYSTAFVLRMWLNGDTTSQSVSDYSPYEFMLKSSVTDNNAINAEDAIDAGNFITSTAYYALSATGSCSDNTKTTESECVSPAVWTPAARDAYERIAYVDPTNKTVLTRSQAIALGYAAYDNATDMNFVYDPTNGTVQGLNQTEQYYQVNGQSYTVKVNVYAEGAKVATN